MKMNMNRRFTYLLLCLLTLLTACGGGKQADAPAEESREAKAMLQGVWVDEETETIVFKMQGDSVFYPDSTSVPAYFKVVGDTLYIGSSARYHIERHTEHVLWFNNQEGELMKLNKGDEESSGSFVQQPTQILTLTEVQKRDTVVFYNGERYHIYIAVNPTKYKVTRTTLNEDGLSVDNVYYDNIIHLSIFHGARQIFSRDFRKQIYQQHVAANLLSQSVLNNMTYEQTNAEGFHFNTSVCIPGDAACFLIEHVVSFNGKLTTKRME